MSSQVWRVGFIVAVLLVITSCKSVLENPLLGSSEGGDPSGITGEWALKGSVEELSLTIEKRTERGLYGFSYKENDEPVQGTFELGRFGNNLIFNVNLRSLTSEGTRVIDISAPRYLLIGVYFSGDKLVLVPADMEVLEKKLATHFSAPIGDFADGCGPVNEPEPSANFFCQTVMSNTKVLFLNESASLNTDFLKAYDEIFPIVDALVLQPNS